MPTERRIRELTLYPSSDTSADWNTVSAAVRNNSFFSACIEDERLLGALQKLVGKAVDEGWSVGGFIDEALQKLDAIALAPDTPKDETFRDNFERLYDVERLRLIYMTQWELSDGYRRFNEAFSPYQLHAYPAWEFHRQPGAKEENKRADHVQHEGDIRLKTDVAYWLDRNRPDIGGFGNPYGPWGFNSWMRELPVDREKAEALGLVKPDEKLSIPPALAEWGLPQAVQQMSKAGVADLTSEQRQNVVNRCQAEGIAVQAVTPDDASAREPTALQVVATPDAPLTQLEDAMFDAWILEEANRLDAMEQRDWLGALLGSFLLGKFFKGVESLFAGKRRKDGIPMPDGTRCFTEDCQRHKGTTREGETPAVKRTDKQAKERSNVLFADDRCSVFQHTDGSIVVHAHKIATAKDATESLQRVIAQCREKRKGQLLAKRDYGYMAPGQQIEFFVSGRTINECVENQAHIARSDCKEVHLSAAAVIDKLWEATQEGIRRKPKKKTPKDKQIQWVHERYAVMKMKKAYYRVKITAFEYRNKQEAPLLYDIMATKMPQRVKRLL